MHKAGFMEVHSLNFCSDSSFLFCQNQIQQSLLWPIVPIVLSACDSTDNLAQGHESTCLPCRIERVKTSVNQAVVYVL